MIYLADLHVHSKYSRATSPESNLLNLAKWATIKGIDVLATGDFTHPKWRQEIMEYLEPDGSGLFRLRKNALDSAKSSFPLKLPANVRFILNVEISSIYKAHGKVRKIHNLVFMPDYNAMNRFCSRLDSIGNLNSDGRPILGVRSRDLLEIALEASQDSFVIPAHIWTPWFSLLGSKSGFSSVEECFEDLSGYIFALETGLSSDPDMNRRVSSLDNYTLVSNSDTHSPSRLGRELNIFSGNPGYASIRDGLKTGGMGSNISEVEPDPDSWDLIKQELNLEEDRFLGTIEFFPEEGKYHWDGHKKCKFRSDPLNAIPGGNRCPVCGSPYTVGVLSRVCELADRITPKTGPKSGYFWKMVPLVEVISSTMNLGTKSQKVNKVYFDMVNVIGPEINILWDIPIKEISRIGPEKVADAIEKVRNRHVIIEPGYDGEYGKVKIQWDKG